MPNGWVHATIALITLGRPYFDLHREKDAASRILGPRHRTANHDWYQSFGSRWTMVDPFPSELSKETEEHRRIRGPDFAELQQASVSHDYFDRLWDGLSASERKYWEAFMLWLLLNPTLLTEWAGVDVVEGKIQRIVDGREIWEPCPELKHEYKRLRAYAEAVWRKDPLLRDFLARYG